MADESAQRPIREEDGPVTPVASTSSSAVNVKSMWSPGAAKFVPATPHVPQGATFEALKSGYRGTAKAVPMAEVDATRNARALIGPVRDRKPSAKFDENVDEWYRVWTNVQREFAQHNLTTVPRAVYEELLFAVFDGSSVATADLTAVIDPMLHKSDVRKASVLLSKRADVMVYGTRLPGIPRQPYEEWLMEADELLRRANVWDWGIAVVSDLITYTHHHEVPALAEMHRALRDAVFVDQNVPAGLAQSLLQKARTKIAGSVKRTTVAAVRTEGRPSGSDEGRAYEARCYRCLQPGHLRRNCTNPVVCMRCGGSHEWETCPEMPQRA
jgi:hypothetical protein